MEFLKNYLNLVNRDLDKLSKEITSFKNEEIIWVIGKGITNSAGNLSLHICGNLQHYIGAILGKSGYKRDRDFEFSAKRINREGLLIEIQKTKDAVNSTLEQLTDESMQEEYPLEVLGYKMTTQYFLIHLHGHLNYHLGQINYHRRLLD